MTSSGANGLSPEQTREINALLEGGHLSIELISMLQQVSSSSDAIECEKILDQVNDKLIEFSLGFASNAELDLNSKSLTRLSPSLIAFLQKNNDTMINIDLSNNALMSLRAIFNLELPHLQSLILANNPLSKLETEQVITSFPHAKVITDVEPKVILPTPRRNNPQTPHFAKLKTDSARTEETKTMDPKEEGFFKKLFKKR